MDKRTEIQVFIPRGSVKNSRTSDAMEKTVRRVTVTPRGDSKAPIKAVQNWGLRAPKKTRPLNPLIYPHNPTGLFTALLS